MVWRRWNEHPLNCTPGSTLRTAHHRALGRDIPMGKVHLVREFDLKRPWACEMAAILRVLYCIFLLFSKCFMVIVTKLGRDIARSKWHLVREFDLKWPCAQEMVAILRSEITFVHFSPDLLWLFQQNFVGTLLGVTGTWSINMTSNDPDLRIWRQY